MEVAAEAAAIAQNEIPPPNRSHGCFRLIIWCSPSFVIALIVTCMFMLEANNNNVSELTLLCVVIPLSLISTYGIGFFDGMLSRKTISPLAIERRIKLHWHAFIFTAWQFLIVPGFAVLAIGACFAIYAYSY